MRCKNCGWDNPDGNVKCEKCNAPIDGMDSGGMSQYGQAQDNYTPRATVAGGFAPAQEDYNPRPTVAGGFAHAQDDFNPRATVTGCASCGYPVRPDDTACPVCGVQMAGGRKAPEPEPEKPAAKKPVAHATMIQGANFDKETNDTAGRKLTGFLVSYSNAVNGEFFPLYEGKNIIGRADSSNVMIQNDSLVSDKHLSILYRAVDRKFKFKDEQSSNGTFVNDELTDEGILKNNDMIKIGSTRLLFMEIPLSSFEI